MGYHKNQLIADQVELGDRIPAPKLASSHVANLSRKQMTEIRRNVERRSKRQAREFYWMTVSLVIIGALIGFVIGVAVCATQ